VVVLTKVWKSRVF